MAKTLYIQIIFACLALLTSFALPRVKNLATMAGYNRKDWNPRNLATCESKHADTLYGCEDMHLYAEHGERILFLACAASMQDRHDWFPAMGHVSHPKTGIKDRFYAWDLKTDRVTELDTGSWTGDFVSHGIDVVPTSEEREVAIYAINHLPTGSVIEKLVHKVGSSSVSHVRTFDDQARVFTPNDIYVADEKDDFFYTTNDHKFKTGVMRQLETMIQLPTTSIAMHSNAQGGYRIVKSGLQNINGITGDRKSTFYMNHVNAWMSVYGYDESNGNVTFVQGVKLGHASDNPSYSAETGEVIVSGFPRALELADFAQHPHETPAASVLTRINVEHLGSKFFGEGSGGKSNVVQPPLDEFFLDPGTGVMNMSTTAVVDKQGDAWYMTSVFGMAVVKCTGYAATYQTVAQD